MKKALALTLAIAATAAGSAAAQSRMAWEWIPASEILNPDGTLTAEFINTRPEPLGDVTSADLWAALGGKVARLQRKSWEDVGRARDRGLEEGAVLVGRSHCPEHYTRHQPLYQWHWEHPERFDEWVVGASAVMEVQVSKLSPGFNRDADPLLLATVTVLRHLREPVLPFPSEMHIVMGYGEFVAGDAVFCRARTWGGHRLQVGDRLVVGAFGPPSPESKLQIYDQRLDNVFLVRQDESLLRLGPRRVVDGFFPPHLVDFVSDVRRMELDGMLEQPSVFERWRQERAGSDRRVEN